MTRQPDLCEGCSGELAKSGHYEVAIIRDGHQTALWKFDSIACIGKFAEEYKHLDDAIAPNDERDKQG